MYNYSCSLYLNKPFFDVVVGADVVGELVGARLLAAPQTSSLVVDDEVAVVLLVGDGAWIVIAGGVGDGVGQLATVSLARLGTDRGRGRGWWTGNGYLEPINDLYVST